MEKKGKKIIFFGAVTVSLLIISSAAAVPNVQNTPIKNTLNNAVDRNKFWNIDLDDIINKFNLNDDQIKKIESLIDQSNFPLEIYFANVTAFYHYLPENNSLQTLIEGDVREIINSCCSWTTIEDVIIVALNQDENSPEWTQHYEENMPCFNINYNLSPVDIPLNILCGDFNATLLKTSLDLQDIEPLLLIQVEEESTNEIGSNTLLSKSIDILHILQKFYMTTFAECFTYVVFFIVTLHLITPSKMAELFFSCVVINTITNPALNILYLDYDHLILLEFIAFMSESVMIYWFFKTLLWRITLPGAVILSLLANIFSFITAS
jgi:hypothetical protein